MSDDPFRDPKWKRYEKHFVEEVLPRLKESSVVATFVTDEPDVKLAAELGFSVLLNKPIIAIVMPGAEMSPKMAMVADDFVEWTSDTQDMAKRITDAIVRVTRD